MIAYSTVDNSIMLVMIENTRILRNNTMQYCTVRTVCRTRSWSCTHLYSTYCNPVEYFLFLLLSHTVRTLYNTVQYCTEAVVSGNIDPVHDILLFDILRRNANGSR